MGRMKEVFMEHQEREAFYADMDAIRKRQIANLQKQKQGDIAHITSRKANTVKHANDHREKEQF